MVRSADVADAAEKSQTSSALAFFVRPYIGFRRNLRALRINLEFFDPQMAQIAQREAHVLTTHREVALRA